MAVVVWILIVVVLLAVVAASVLVKRSRSRGRVIMSGRRPGNGPGGRR